MKTLETVGLSNVQEVYGGPEGELWELVMGEQIHIGGMVSSMDLAEKAGIGAGMHGIDLCCCSGAGMRFLLRFVGVGAMTGVDATEKMIVLGKRRCEEQDLAGQCTFVLREATDTGLPPAAADFVWGEDAWCYVENKSALITEAVRLAKPGGNIAFTDWVEGPAGLSEAEAERFMAFMKFPSLASVEEYTALLEAQRCVVQHAEDTGRFPAHVDLYLNMLTMQFTYDALRIIGFDQQRMESMAGEMVFMQQLAHAGKIAQGCFIARKK